MSTGPTRVWIARVSRVGRLVIKLPGSAMVGAIRLYQRFLSPLKGPTCKYYPSCSAYAVTAIKRFGPLKGTGLALWRLARCNPWSLGGVDHVPERQGGTHHHHVERAAASGAMGAK